MQGLSEIRQELIGWDWIYGKSPRFTLCHHKLADQRYECKVNVQNGRLADISIVNEHNQSIIVDALNKLIGLPLIECELQVALTDWFKANPSIANLFFKQLVQETLESAFF